MGGRIFLGGTASLWTVFASLPEMEIEIDLYFYSTFLLNNIMLVQFAELGF